MFEIKNGSFYQDGKQTPLYCGELHYFRSLPEQWHDLLEKMKYAGLNAVSTYCCWNLHEPKKGCYDFSGRLDVVRFIKTAQEVGLKVMLRPGPFICAEFENGGLPAWLLADPEVRLRCKNEAYIKCLKDYFKELLTPILPYLETNGGNIIAVQVENEYSSFGDDEGYLQIVKNLYKELGIDVLLYSADGHTNFHLGTGNDPEIFRGIDFGYAPENTAKNFQYVTHIQPGAPLFRSEFWAGMFDHWGANHMAFPSELVDDEVATMLNIDANFSLYMFHGGTNYGFTNGANILRSDGSYKAITTSYDYDAFLTEWGGYTNKYHKLRKQLLEKQGLEPQELPPEPERQNIGRVTLTESGNLFESLDVISEHFQSVTVESMEKFGQNSGFILYRNRKKGNYHGDRLEIEGLADRATIFVDGKRTGILMRSESKWLALGEELDKDASLDILVENMGRVGYGPLTYFGDRKGITGYVALNRMNGDVVANTKILFDWDVFTIPLDDISKIKYTGNAECPAFFRGTFHANKKAECFIHLPHFTKGVVFVNGMNLGRYWNIGPQYTLYLPGCILKDENEIVVFELEKYEKPEIEIIDHPIFDDGHRMNDAVGI